MDIIKVTLHFSPGVFRLYRWFQCGNYKKWITWADFDLIVLEFVTSREEVPPLYGLEKLFFTQVPLEPLCLNFSHFPKSYHAATFFLDHVSLHINCIVDFLV